MPRGGVRQGAGRKVGSTKAAGLPTKVVRVSVELPNELYQRLPELLATINYREMRWKLLGLEASHFVPIRRWQS